MGALWGLYAAVLDPRISFLVANGGLLSYKLLVQSDRYKVGADIMIPGVLKQFDLPQAAAALADRRLVIISPTGPMKTPVPLEDVHQAYRFAANVYETLGAKEQFQIIANNPTLGPAAQYHALLSESTRG